MMKLGITTYNIFRDWDLETLCAELPKAGVEGIEFRIDAEHRHGVELSTTPGVRERIRAAVADAGLCTCSIATGFQFHWQDEEHVRADIEGSKQAIRLARDLDCPRIRVFGNDFPEGCDPDTVAVQVGSALRDLGPFAEAHGVDVLLEMHGDFNAWRQNKMAVQFANHRAVASLYNCSPRDIVNDSIRSVYGEMKALIRHIHFHDLTDVRYPYAELFALLAEDGYNGFMSMEVSMEGDVVTHLQEQAKLFSKLRGNT